MIVKTDKSAFWQQHQQNWLDSGLSQKAYCQQHNLSYHVFMYWGVRQKHTANNANVLPSIVPVQIEQRARLAQHFPAIEIHFGLAKIILSPSMPAEYVGNLVRSLA